MKNAVIITLAVLLGLSVILGAVLGAGNKCPEPNVTPSPTTVTITSTGHGNYPEWPHQIAEVPEGVNQPFVCIPNIYGKYGSGNMTGLWYYGHSKYKALYWHPYLGVWIGHEYQRWEDGGFYFGCIEPMYEAYKASVKAYSAHPTYPIDADVIDSSDSGCVPPEPTPTPVPTAIPTTPAPTPLPTVTPTPTPQFTGVRLYVEDNRYTYSSCTEAYLVKTIGQDICTSEISYGHDSICVPGQVIEDTGMVYKKVGSGSYELVYMSGLGRYFLTEQEYVSFCIEAGINSSGTL